MPCFAIAALIVAREAAVRSTVLAVFTASELNVSGMELTFGYGKESHLLYSPEVARRVERFPLNS